MHVVLVTNDFPPAHGGIQRYMRALADELSAQAYDVSVIAPHHPRDADLDARVSYEVLRYRGGSLTTDFRSMIAKLIERIGRRSAPVASIASLWFPAGLALALLPRRVRGRLLVLVHGAELQPTRGGVRRRLLRFVLGRADAVIANSTYTASLVARCGIDRTVDVVNCGVDAFDVAKTVASEPTILSVGRLVRRKGFDRLIRAMPAVIASIPSARCEIVGDGPLRTELEAEVRALGIDRHVRFLGAVDDDELHAAYGRATCFALPVRNDSDDVEGFGIVYLEAAMAQLPCVGGIDSGAQDAIVDGQTGILVDGNDPAAIGGALIRLLSDPELATRMGRAGRERASSAFTWSQCASRIVRFIH